MHLGAFILLCYEAQNTGIAKATARLCNEITGQNNKRKKTKLFFIRYLGTACTNNEFFISSLKSIT